MAEGRRRLADARTLLDAGGASGVVGLAYYAMLYAARAALSEEDRNARTHRGTWDVFHDLFVVSGRFDAGLAERARKVQARREAADYDAAAVPRDEAAEMVALAERFVAAVHELLV